MAPEAQIRSTGTSGYWVDTLGLEVDNAPQVVAVQRALVPKLTRSGGLL